MLHAAIVLLAYLPKPVEPAELLAVLAGLLKRPA